MISCDKCGYGHLTFKEKDACKTWSEVWAEQLVERIDNYLTNGGLFNPEAMEHDKVRQLLIECQNHLKSYSIGKA